MAPKRQIGATTPVLWTSASPPSKVKRPVPTVTVPGLASAVANALALPSSAPPGVWNNTSSLWPCLPPPGNWDVWLSPVEASSHLRAAGDTSNPVASSSDTLSQCAASPGVSAGSSRDAPPCPLIVAFPKSCLISRPKMINPCLVPPVWDHRPTRFESILSRPAMGLMPSMVTHNIVASSSLTIASGSFPAEMAPACVAPSIGSVDEVACNQPLTLLNTLIRQHRICPYTQFGACTKSSTIPVWTDITPRFAMLEVFGLCIIFRQDELTPEFCACVFHFTKDCCLQ